MFKRILIPTDGSELSYRAACEGLELACALDAAVIGFFAPEEYNSFLANEYMPPALLPETEYEAKLRSRVDETLSAIARAARGAGVRYESFSLPALTPWPAIIDAARQKQCDLIVMASRTRSGLSALLRGSQAWEVMTHSEIPVLVWRESELSAHAGRRSWFARERRHRARNAGSDAHVI